MAVYWPLRLIRDEEEKRRIVAGLERLRKQLRKDIPMRTLRDTLLLATWNIRDFDSNKFRHGPRQRESLYYIAEIISSFDLVAVQEVNWRLHPLRRVMKILGPDWDFITTDITAGSSGNNERMAFVFDKRKIRFLNVAGQVVLPKKKRVLKELQFARTPFAVSFQSGWFKFDLCTVHVFYGSDSGAKLKRRIAEINSIASFLARRAKKNDANTILLGDFNIKHPKDPTMEALTNNGFEVPELLQKPTNMMLNKYYDQIAFMVRENELRLGDGTPNAGVCNFYTSVYRDADWNTYYGAYSDIGGWAGQPATDAGRKAYFKKWRTFQMSDHLPLWVELKIDFSDDYLASLVPGP